MMGDMEYTVSASVLISRVFFLLSYFQFQYLGEDLE